MVDELLQTKLFIAPMRPAMVERTGLIRRLNQGIGRKVTIVAAATGYGKTTLISAWLAQQTRAAAWLSLDPGDDVPARFFAYFIAAIRTVAPTFSTELALALRTTPPPDTPALVAPLLNELTRLETPLILVLDDYHVITNTEIHEALNRLLQYLPPTLHLVICSRTEPALALGRLRARNAVNDVVASDLLFTTEETGRFLNKSMGLQVSEELVSGLEKRTEGWVAGLQLAALTLQNRPDVGFATEQFLSQVTGSNRHIADYLVEEVLQTQSAETRAFLLQTSILETFDADLCDAVLSRPHSRQILDRLERNNLFLIPLDNSRRQYRYHHLFAELLRNRLATSHPPKEIAALYSRAITWHKNKNQLPKAIAYALIIQDYESAAQMIGTIPLDTVYFEGGGAEIANWGQQIPDAVIQNFPNAGVIITAAALVRGELHTLRHYLGLLSNTPEAARAVALFRSVLIRNEDGNLTDALALAKQAVVDEPGDHDLINIVARIQVAVCLHMAGDLEAADQTLSDMRDLVGVHNVPSLTMHLQTVAMQMNNAFALGNLREVERLGLDGAAQAKRDAAIWSPLVGLMYNGLGQVHYEWNELDQAEAYSSQAMTIARRSGISDILIQGSLLEAQLACCRGDRKQVEQVVADLLSQFAEARVPRINQMIRNAAAWYLLRLGDVSAAAKQMDVADITLDAVPSWGDFEIYHTLIAVRLAESRLSGNHANLPHLLKLTVALERLAIGVHHVPATIRCLVTKALILDLAGDTDAGRVLANAVRLAGQNNMVRMLLDEGRPLHDMLQRAQLKNPFAQHILLLFATENHPIHPAQPQKSLIALTGREDEILRLIDAGLSNREIEQKLFISKNTVRTHIKNLYGKLSAESRTQAIRRARELNLI